MKAAIAMKVIGNSFDEFGFVVSEGVLIGVGVGVEVGVGVGDGEGEAVEVDDGVGVEVGNIVGIGVGVGVEEGARLVMVICVKLLPPEPSMSKPSGPTMTSLGAGNELLGRFVPLTW